MATHRSTGLIRRILFALTLVLLALALGHYGGIGLPSKKTGLSLKMDKMVRVEAEPELACAALAAQKPIVILALGQSNAANHGARAADTDIPVNVIADGKCVLAVNPLPGGTGTEGSIWYRLPRDLNKLLPKRPVVLSVLAVESTTIAEWTDAASPLRKRLERQIDSMKSLGMPPQLILWQQGESDARHGITEIAYSAGLDQLADIVDQSGVSAPIVMALSTVCRSEPYEEIRRAVEAKVANYPRFKIGPDTDYAIHVGLRRENCHFSAEGIHRASQLWAESIAPLLSKKRP